MYLSILVGVAVVMRSTNIQVRTVVMGIGASASMVVPVVFVLLALRARLSLPGRGFFPLLRFAATAHLGTILQYLNGRLDLLALSFLVAPVSLGFYSVGAALGQLSVLTANAGVVRGITGEAKATDFVGLAFAGLVAALVILAAPLVIPLVFGQSFVAAVPIARILAIGGVANFALQGACGRLLRRRQPWMVVLSQGVGVAVFVIGIAIFRTIEGVAWSSVLSFVTSLLVAQAALHLIDER
jgi:O-antigen/teichoic acid export membrane protein